MRNKLSGFAVPYVIWMALFVVIPILIMVVYAFTTAEFEGTLENFSEMGIYASVCCGPTPGCPFWRTTAC